MTNYIIAHILGSTIILFMVAYFVFYTKRSLLHLRLKFHQLEIEFDDKVPHWLDYPYSDSYPEYSLKEDYFKGMIVSCNYKSFVCNRNNGPSTQIIKPKTKDLNPRIKIKTP